MNDAVDAAWREILITAGEPVRPEGSPLLEAFAAMVRAARAEPALRRLHPWTGMWELHFSRCTGMPYTWDVPYIGVLGTGWYYVEGPLRTSPRIAETDSVRAAVAAVVGRLPTGCGPAFVGSADRLAAHESSRGA